MFRTHPELFQDPHINDPIDDLDLPFAEYITRCQTIIQQTRLDLIDNPHANAIVQANSPFELRPTTATKKISYGVLLIHGLLDSPFMVRDFGYALQSEGALVRSILLPGHGTRPGALLNVTFEQWLQAVRYGIASFVGQVDRLVLVGYSTGASLALHESLQHPGLHRIGLTSPALKLYSKIAFASNWYRAIEFCLAERGLVTHHRRR